MSHRIPSQAQTYSKRRFPAAAPKYAVSAQGPYVTCSDGRTYVDAVAALGPIMLGHRWNAVEEAALAQARKGISFSLPTALEEQLAERLCTLTGLDMMRLGKNGNDVVNAAVRIARAATGRQIVWAEDGAYHGHADWALLPPKDAGIAPEAGCMVLRFPRGDLNRLAHCMVMDPPAAVVLDPVPAHDPTLPALDYFREIRRLCDETGALLILDEMVTGFRAGWPGAINTYGIKPDLWCGAKALGNGWPVTALLGKCEYMERIDTDVFYSTTFAGEVVSIAAALACLDEMERLGAYPIVRDLGQLLTTWYRAQIKDRGLEGFGSVVGYASRPVFRWSTPELDDAFLTGVVEGGMLCQGYVNMMVAHADCWPQILAALTNGLDAVQRAILVAA